MIDWQPFNTAPKDGTEILVYFCGEPNSRDSIKIMKWQKDVRNRIDRMDWFDQYNYSSYFMPSFWAPINLPSNKEF